MPGADQRLHELRALAGACTACDLYRDATQVVFGEGRAGGKVRIHAKPNAAEVKACRPWLEKELEVVEPRVVVCLGATAAQALLGRNFKVTQRHGQWVEWPYAPKATATVHPSSILRAPDADARRAAYDGFVGDLRIVAAELER